MKKNHQIKSLTISKSRWLSYAAAGAATAVSGVGSAEADIHYSGTVKFPFRGTDQVSSGYFPLNNSASLFFQHFNLAGQSGAARIEIFGPDGRAGGSIGGLVGSFMLYEGFAVSNLAPRVKLSQLRFDAYCRYTSSGSELHCFGGTIGYSRRRNGKFQQPGRGYIGFTFDAGQGPQYGWARIRTNGGPQYHLLLMDYAWADPGEGIETGQTQRAAKAELTTKSGALGLLAVGNVGLMAWRNSYPKDVPQLP